MRSDIVIMAVLMILICPLQVAAGAPGHAENGMGTWVMGNSRTESVELAFQDPVILEGQGLDGNDALFLEDTSLLALPGLPRVPFRTIQLEFPVGTTIMAVRATYNGQSTATLQGRIEAAAPTFTIGPDGSFGDMPIEMFYDGGTFPADWYAYDVGRGLNDDGEARIFVNIWAYPVRVEGTGPEQRVHHINDLEIMIDHAPPDAPEGRDHRDGQYDLILIGPAQFEDELQVLADHKDATGLKSRVVTLTDIYQGNIFDVQGRDNAERIKYFIKDAIESWGIEYVLLGGDTDKVPCRHTLVSDGYDDDGGYHLDGEWVLSDIYFGDIYDGNNDFSSWDENGNGTFGEWVGGRDGHAADDPDLYLDVYVGRFPASTASELEGLIEKTIGYENNTDWDWYFDATIAALDIFPTLAGDEGQISGDILADDLQGKGYTIEKLYEAHGTLSGTAINSAINDGTGIISMIGHGTFSAWGSNTTLYYQNSNIDNLHNGVKLPVGTQASCLTAAFDNGDPHYPGPANVDSMGEEFVLEADGGHIVNYGYSRVAYGGKGVNHSNESSGYMNNVLFNAVADGHSTPGAVLNKARNDCIAYRGVSFVGDYKHMQMFHMFGDPSVALGGIGISLTTADAMLEIDPGKTLQADIIIANTGVYDTAATISLATDSTWQSSIDQSLMDLPAGQEKKVTLSVQVATEALANETGHFTVTAVSSHSDRSSSITVQVKANQTHALDLYVADDELSLQPGQEGIFELLVVNMGNGPESVSLSTTDAPVSLSPQFSLDHFNIPVLGNATSDLVVAVPEQSDPTDMPFNVTVAIEGTAITESILLTVNVLPKSSIGLVCLLCPDEVAPGTEAEIWLEVHNYGNIVQDLPVNVTVPDGWSSSSDQANGTVQPYSSETVKVLVRASDVAMNGMYHIGFYVSNGLEVINISMDLTVPTVRGLSLSVVSTAFEMVNGEMFTLLLTVNNTGNVLEDVTFQIVEPPTAWIVDDPLSIMLPPFSGLDIECNMTPPSDAEAGDYALRVLVKADNGLEAEEMIPVRMAEMVRGEATLNEGIMAALPGATLSSMMFYHNTGNVGTGLTLHSTSDDDLSLVLMGDTVTVEPGGIGEVPFKLKVSDDARAGPLDYILLIERDNGVSMLLNGTVEVQQVFGLDVAIDPTPRTIDPGKRLNRKVILKNTGNGMDTVTIKITGSTSKWATVSEGTVNIGPGESKVVYVDVVPSQEVSAGGQVLILEMTYGSGDVVKKNLDYEISSSKGPVNSLGTKVMLPVAIATVITALVLIWLIFGRRSPKKEAPAVDDPEDAPEGTSEKKRTSKNEGT